jgi:hypothetical protein
LTVSHYQQDFEEFCSLYDDVLVEMELQTTYESVKLDMQFDASKHLDNDSAMLMIDRVVYSAAKFGCTEAERHRMIQRILLVNHDDETPVSMLTYYYFTD